MRRALCAKGADVVVVAPWGAQSGAGTAGSPDGSTFAVSQRTVMPAGFEGDCSSAPSGGAVFGVCVSTTTCSASSPSATPSDTARLGIRGLVQRKVGWSAGPDLLVSGANAGGNIANFVNGSGTVGAAIAALDLGVPAVAVSANYAVGGFSVSPETYRATAESAASIIESLWRKGLVNQRFGININHPATTDLKSSKPVFTQVATGSFLSFGVAEADAPDTYTLTGAICASGVAGCLRETQPRPDTKYLVEQGRITVSAIDRDRTYTGLGSVPLALALAAGL